MSLPIADGEPYSNAAEMSSWCLYIPNRLPGEAIFAVFNGDIFIDLLWEQTLSTTTMDARCDVEWVGVWLRILQVAVIFLGMNGFIYHIVMSQSLLFHSAFDQ